MTSNWQLGLLHQNGLRPKRSLSQNFLIDETYLGRIADSAELSATDSVLEVGPGLGGLTWQLAARARQVLAVEIDESLASILQREFRDEHSVHIVGGDILNCHIPELWARSGLEQPNAIYKVVANLPYHAANRILMHLLEGSEPKPVRITILLQDDVARRICAHPGSMSLLSVGAQFHAACCILLRIPGGAFFPAPKVRSALVDLQTYPASLRSGVDARVLFTLARAGFGQKRKQLVNSISHGLGLPRGDVQVRLNQAQVDPSRRAETLTVEEWIAVSTAFNKESPLQQRFDLRTRVPPRDFRKS